MDHHYSYDKVKSRDKLSSDRRTLSDGTNMHQRVIDAAVRQYSVTVYTRVLKRKTRRSRHLVGYFET